MSVIQSRMALAKTKKMYCIKYIRLAHAIQTGEAIEPRRKVKGLRRVTFEIREF